MNIIYILRIRVLVRLFSLHGCPFVPPPSLFVATQQSKVAAARRTGLTAAAFTAAASRASFAGSVGGGVGGGGNMHARRMLSAHVWRTTFATRVLARPRPVVGLTNLQGDQLLHSNPQRY